VAPRYFGDPRVRMFACVSEASERDRSVVVQSTHSRLRGEHRHQGFRHSTTSFRLLIHPQRIAVSRRKSQARLGVAKKVGGAAFVGAWRCKGDPVFRNRRRSV